MVTLRCLDTFPCVVISLTEKIFEIDFSKENTNFTSSDEMDNKH
jgi:hypothetical protein